MWNNNTKVLLPALIEKQVINMTDAELVKAAAEAKEHAYAPYSKFKVGCALLTESDRLYTGINIENASYGATNCAERTAIFKAVSDGNTKIKAVAIASDSNDMIFPCGICRQVMVEFGDADTKVICSTKNGEFKVYTLDEVLPNAFTKIR
jgi:cytidine deaminase